MPWSPPEARGSPIVPSGTSIGAASERVQPHGTPDGAAAAGRLRLMQVTHDLGVGGLPRVVETLCKSIDRTRFDVSVLCLLDKGPLADGLEADGIPVVQIPQNTSGPDYFAFLKVARELRRYKIDVVHTHNTQPFVDGGIGALLARTPTLIHTDHARLFPDKRRYMFAEHCMSHLAYKVVGVSEHTSQNLLRYERMARRKVVTIPNGIDGTIYRESVDLRAKREELGIPAGAPIIGFAARLTEQKGVGYLLHATARLATRVPDVRLLIAGEGPLEGNLRRLARELGLEANVRFLGVRLDMPELLHLFDAFILSSVWEGLPMAVLEALAAGCPIVATRVGGVPSAITHGVNGSLVEPEDPDLLAVEIERVLGDSAIRERYAEEGKRVFEERFSADAMTRAYERLYLRQD